jgi:hypothetical protein
VVPRTIDSCDLDAELMGIVRWEVREFRGGESMDLVTHLNKASGKEGTVMRDSPFKTGRRIILTDNSDLQDSSLNLSFYIDVCFYILLPLDRLYLRVSCLLSGAFCSSRCRLGKCFLWPESGGTEYIVRCSKGLSKAVLGDYQFYN